MTQPPASLPNPAPTPSPSNARSRRAERRGLILAESGRLRLFSFFLFYLAQGLPAGLTVVALPAWMAASGVADGQVGELVAWAYFAWTYKFVLAAVMDRYTFAPMGRRRIWLIGAQALMAGGFIAAAWLDPGPADFALLVGVTVLVMTGAATQDVAVDGLAVDLLPEREQGTTSAYMFGGQAFGMAAAGAAGGAGLHYLGAQATFLLFIPVLAIPTAFALILRERRGERLLPWTSGEPAPAAQAMQGQRYFGADGQFMITLRSLVRGPSLWFMLSQSLMRTAGGIITPLLPILGTSFLMLSPSQYTATVGSVDLAMAFAGLAAGGWLTLRLGARIASAVIAAAGAALMVLVMIGQDWWVRYPVFVGLLCAWALVALLSSICTNPLRMQLSDKRVGATQFTIYNSIANLPVALGAWLLGRLGGSADLPQTLGVAAGLFALSALGFALLKMPAPVPEDPQQAPAADSLPGPARLE